MQVNEGPTLTQAREMVANWHAIAPKTVDSPSRLNRLLGTDALPNHSRVAEDAVNARLRDAIGRDHLAVVRHVARLYDQALADLFLDGQLLGPLQHVLASILSFPRSGERGAQEANWNEILRWASLRSVVSGSVRLVETPRSHAIAVAVGACTLRNAGYSIARPEGRVELSNASEDAFLADLERHIRLFGGLNLVRQIFRELEPSYRADLDRYCVQRSVAPMHGVMPERPYAYLLALAIKHIHHAGTADERVWAGIRDMTTAYAALLDAQDYGEFLIDTRDTDMRRSRCVYSRGYFAGCRRGNCFSCARACQESPLATGRPLGFRVITVRSSALRRSKRSGSGTGVGGPIHSQVALPGEPGRKVSVASVKEIRWVRATH